MIEKVKERTAFNRRNNRTDTPRKYLLSGFLRCEECGINLTVQTQKNRNDKEYQYYRHPRSMEKDKCFAFSKISGARIEKAVLYTIFENIIDLPNFEKAIGKSLPDETKIEALKETINRSEKELQQVERDLDKIVEAVISGTLTKETVKGREKQLLDKKDLISKELDKAQKELDYMPDIEDIKKHANEIRQKLLTQYGGTDRLEAMTFEDKRRLLHWLFDGKGPDGKPYGIYIKKHGRGKAVKVDYFMYGRITGLRTIKGDDFNYQNWDEDKEEDEGDLLYKTNVPPQGSVSAPYILRLD